MRVERIASPISLGPGDGPIENVTFEVDVEAFSRAGKHPSIIHWRDGSDVRMRNVRLVGARAGGFDPAWVQEGNPPGWSQIISGVRCGETGVRSIEIDGLHVEGVPSAGLEIRGVTEGGHVNDSSFYRCLSGIHTSPYGETRSMIFQDCHVADTWRPLANLDPALWGSRRYPGSAYGSNGFALHNLRMSEIVGCSTGGENKGWKLVNPYAVAVMACRINSLSVQGSYGVAPDIGGAQREVVSTVLWVVGNVFDLTKDESPALQARNWQGLRFQRNFGRAAVLNNLFATLPAYGGAAIEVDVSASAHAPTAVTVKGNTMWGWRTALEVEGSAAINRDWAESNRIEVRT